MATKSKANLLKSTATTRAGIGAPNKPKLAAQRILPGKLPKGAKVRNTSADMPEPYTPPDEHHVSMRKIANGYLIKQHGYVGGNRFEHEQHSPTKPSLQFSAAKRAARLAGKVL